MSENLNQRWAATLIGALVGGGVKHAVIAPGSRSTPLALALADRPDVKCWSVIDERSAAFFALGLSKSTGTPAAVVCTSGSAGAHFLPAIMEADQGGTPLVILTADRPWELHGFGAPQTIPQVGMFGRYVRGAEALPAPDDEGLTHLAAVTSRLVHLACSTRGAVHFNVPFREPLAPIEGSPALVLNPVSTSFAKVAATPELTVVNAAIAGAQRGLIVCGPRERNDDFGTWVHELGTRLGFPVVAEAASNARFGFPGAITVLDTLLRNPKFAASMKPDVVLRFGGGLTAKAPQAWLDTCGARIFQFTDDGAQFDPQHRVEQVIHFSPLPLGAKASGPMEQRGNEGGGEGKTWHQSWKKSQDAVMGALSRVPKEITEPLIAREFIAALPPHTSVFLSSSMPIRDVDAFSTSPHPLRVFTNRGVNGIDGITSTALGVAAGTARPTALLIGDVATLHDLSGLLIARRHHLNLTVVMVNNDGGGIFHFLPIAGRTPHFEELFGTPHGVDLTHVAALANATLHRPTDLTSFGRTVTRCLEGGLHLIEVCTQRNENVDAHRAIFAKLAEVAS
ncbi:MAG: 2-succinyl-5-enolpyruvyl-6-hydroxy-3-cyclohexene-1-carboxylic-acid synthase [Archangium sp.]|nr:2-succinyl-5-enolpyruvyl-6-hydroxy-3-cyclohexene-1-carboxylic-acid synthase [Archangium sp.]